MAWCPKCEEEYENHITECAACKVELVNSLEEVSHERILMVLETEDEVDKVLEFLDYSGIQTAKQQETTSEAGIDAFLITVDEAEWGSAQRFMQGYALVEKEDKDYEDYYFDKYKTIDVESESQLAEIKSSYLSFIGLGALILVAGVINLLKIASFLTGNLPIVFSVMGIIFITIGIYTRLTMTKKVSQVGTIKESFEELYKWYVTAYPVESFFDRHQVDTSGLDEGVRYFTLMDLIIEECATTTLTENEELVNTVAERIYAKL